MKKEEFKETIRSKINGKLLEKIHKYIPGIYYIDLRGDMVKDTLKQLNVEFSEEDSTLLGNLCFIWGIKSKDDLNECEPNFDTLNDISLIYDKKKKEFFLEIETAYHFENKIRRNKYLFRLLSELEDFLKSKGIATNEAYLFDFSQCTIPLRDYDISQLFAQFRVIVRGLELEEME